MFKRVLLVSLVLFSLMFSEMAGKCLADAATELKQAEKLEKYGHYERVETAYKSIVTTYPGTDCALESQKKLTMLYIALDKQQEAEAALQELTASFSKNVGIAKAVHDIARHYGEYEKYEKANELFQYVMAAWPADEHAMWSQAGVAKLHISIDDETAAQAAIDKLVADFFDNKLIAGAIWYVAQHYKQLKRYEKAKELYRYVINTWPGDEYVLWSLSCLAMSNTSLDDMAAADAAIAELVADFSNDQRIGEAVYDIAENCNRLGKYEKAREIFQHVLDNWPACTHATWTKIGLVQANIGLGDYTTAEAIIDGLVAKLNTDLVGGPNLVVVASEGYYYAGNCYRQLGEYEKSMRCYQTVVDNCPDYEYAWNAQFLIGRNYECLKKSGGISELEADPEIKAAYEQLVNTYPDCPAVEIAHRWLSRHNSK